MTEGLFFEPEPENPTFFEIENSPELIAIKPALSIIAPKGLEIEIGNLKTALNKVLKEAETSVDELRRRGVDYSGRKVYPNPIFIKMDEIKGTEHPTGWMWM